MRQLIFFYAFLYRHFCGLKRSIFQQAKNQQSYFLWFAWSQILCICMTLTHICIVYFLINLRRYLRVTDTVWKVPCVDKNILIYEQICTSRYHGYLEVPMIYWVRVPDSNHWYSSIISLFASLTGQSAGRELKGISSSDTSVLITSIDVLGIAEAVCYGVAHPSQGSGLLTKPLALLGCP